MCGGAKGDASMVGTFFIQPLGDLNPYLKMKIPAMVVGDAI
jgi:hypothetical protein